MMSLILIPLLALGLYFLRIVYRKKPIAPLPPGPPSKPIISNLADLPADDAHHGQHWLKHKELYGPISSVTVFGQTLVILNDAQYAVDLMDKRSAIHSARPDLPFLKMAGWDNVMATIEYTTRYKAIRKALHQEIGTVASVSRFDHVVDVETRRFLFRLLETPDDLVHHLAKESRGIILKIGYGYNVEPHKRDPLVDVADKAMDDFSQALLPGKWIVDIVPILRYVPSWLPGAGFAQIAKQYKETSTAFVTLPYKFVQQRMARKNYEPSFLSNLFETTHVEPGSEEEIIFKWAAGSLFTGGSDTMVAALSGFFYAMTLYPEVQKKAQEELDRVIGTERLPQFDDRNNLPYINALVWESLRWHTTPTTGVPHMSIKDDIFNGYLIPKESLLIPNIWAFHHDPDLYHDPDTFKPERFLATPTHIPERDPLEFTFGFGRRACPGRLLGDSNIFLTIARSLACFNISNIDNEQNDKKPELQPGGIAHPAPFKCSIRPRSEKHAELVRAVETEHPWEESDADEIRQLMQEKASA